MPSTPPNGTRRAVAMVSLAAVAAASGCSSAPAEPAQPTGAEATPTAAVESSSPPNTMPSPTPRPGVVVDDGQEVEVDAHGIHWPFSEALGITATGPEFTDAYGTYRRAEIAAGSPLLEPTTEAYDEAAVEQFGPEFMEESERYAAEFIVEYIMDGQAIYEPTQELVEAHLVETAPLISEDWRNEWLLFKPEEVARLGAGAGRMDTTVALSTFHDDAEYPPYADDRPRYALNSLVLTEAVVHPHDDTSAVFKFDVFAQRPALLTAGAAEPTLGSFNIKHKQWVATRTRADGGLEISGWNGDYNTYAIDAQWERYDITGNDD